jgi:hypothetical protein
MFHANTERLIAEWIRRRGSRLAPSRADIEPGDFRELLPQILILGRDDDGAWPFRLAGGLISELHAADLRGVCFFSLWMGQDRDAARDAFLQAAADGSPAVLEATAWTAAGDRARMEITLAGLTGPSGALDRALGLYQPVSSVRRLMGAAIEALTLDGVGRPAGRVVPFPRVVDRSHLRLAARDGRRVDERA